MKKVIVIGCPGSGKSVFSRALHAITGLPLYHLDMINWHEDKTTLSREELIAKINAIGATDAWIMDGNYGGTMELRMALCDTIIFLDYPTEVCLAGIMARRGTQRPDLPWPDAEELEEDFVDSVKNYNTHNRSTVLERIRKFPEKEVHIFHSRNEADGFLAALKDNCTREGSLQHRNIQQITDFIFVGAAPCEADAIFVVGGSLAEAAELAADLYQKGYADKLIIGGKYSVKRDGFPLPDYATEYDFCRDILLKNGVKAADIYGEKASGYTKQNAEFAKRVVEASELHIKKALIVCKSFHAKRCLLLYQMVFPDVAFTVVTFDGFGVSKENWHQTAYGRERVLGELKRIEKQCK